MNKFTKVLIAITALVVIVTLVYVPVTITKYNSDKELQEYKEYIEAKMQREKEEAEAHNDVEQEEATSQAEVVTQAQEQQEEVQSESHFLTEEEILANQISDAENKVSKTTAALEEAESNYEEAKDSDDEWVQYHYLAEARTDAIVAKVQLADLRDDDYVNKDKMYTELSEDLCNWLVENRDAVYEVATHDLSSGGNIMYVGVDSKANLYFSAGGAYDYSPVAVCTVSDGTIVRNEVTVMYEAYRRFQNHVEIHINGVPDIDYLYTDMYAMIRGIEAQALPRIDNTGGIVYSCTFDAVIDSSMNSRTYSCVDTEHGLKAKGYVSEYVED